jgi:hypothetical protein
MKHLPAFFPTLTFGALLALLLAAPACETKTDRTGPMPAAQPYDVAAYIWPSCHHDPRFGDMLWPDGQGEWEIIRKGTPRFEGHYQPKVPLWGYEPDNDPAVMEKWIEAATGHGVNVFIFDWYWFDGGPFLESSLNDGFLKAGNRDKMQFYLMWANHDVRKNYWNVHRYAGDTAQLWDGAVDRTNFDAVADRVIRNYFSQPNYYRIDGRPVFSVFSLHNLIEGLGGVTRAREALDHFRAETEKAGFPGLHIQAIVFGAPQPGLLETIEALGLDSVTKYNWGDPYREDYIRWGVESMERRAQWDAALNIPYFPNASIGWDDTPRFPHKGVADLVHLNKSPESFAAFLQQAADYCDERPEQPPLITVFSWNEWVEGSYLLPCVKYGFGHLEAVRRVVEGRFNPYETPGPAR